MVAMPWERWFGRFQKKPRTMAVSINYQFLAAVPGGPSVTASEKVSTDSYEFIQVTVEAGEENKKVMLDITEKVVMLVMRADKYDSLSYRKKTANSTEVPITAPLILIGKGAVALIGPSLESLLFTNTGETAREITILISRSTTP